MSNDVRELLLSLPDSDLHTLLRELSEEDRAAAVSMLAESSFLEGRRSPSGLMTERERDLLRKRETRSKASGLIIPDCVNPARRERCLKDPELFLKTYGAVIFYTPFVEHHKAMINAIYERAKTGGDKAVAGPRGEGKTQIATWMMIYIVLACLVRFPVIVASTGGAARKIFRQIQRTFVSNKELIEDFPEVCVPALELDGAPQRGAKQHINGEKTRIIWNGGEIGFPTVPGSPYGGRYITSFGLDCAIRGIHFNGVRPDFALIDDPETHEVANSESQHWQIEEMIDGDIALLCGPDKQMSRVVLTTIQNRRCYSYRVTNRKMKPAFEGDRYGALKHWPTNLDLWQEYIAVRQRAQADGDKDGMAATQFYQRNYDAMNLGAEVSNPWRFKSAVNKDGEAIELDALQSFFNKVADLGMSRVNAELQNDPDIEDEAETIGLTAGKVASRLSGLPQNELPKVDCQVFVGLDIGKYYSHWTKIVSYGNAIQHVIDYGVMETPGMDAKTQPESVQRSLLKALLAWRADVMAVNPPTFCLIDSGDYSQAVYQFVREVGGVPFAASKGSSSNRFHLGSPSKTRKLFEEAWAGLLETEQIWLYNLNSEYWKQQVHERFAVQTFNESHQANDGTLSLFIDSDPKKHLSYSHHIVAEERRDTYIEGKGMVRKWVQVNKNNHWLDATALACAAAGVYGHRLIRTELRLTETPKPRPANQFGSQVADRFKRRDGGWVPKARGR
jgi:hypothetical protein